MLNLYKLRVFSAVAKQGSISKAAEALFLTQSAVSQHVQSLEAALGIKLFERSSRGVTLTAAGDTLLDYSRQILWLVASAESAVANVETMEAGQLRIGATITSAGYLLPTWVRKFHQQFQGIKVSLTTDSTDRIVEQLVSQQLDLGFVEGEWVRHEEIHHTTLQDSELYLVVGPNHPWWGQESISIQDLDRQLFISYPEKSQARQWEADLFESQGVSPLVIAEFDEPGAIKRAVMDGMEAAILPCCVVREERERETVHLISLKEIDLRRPVDLLWNASLPVSPAASAFLETLSEQFPQLSDQEFVGEGEPGI